MTFGEQPQSRRERREAEERMQRAARPAPRTTITRPAVAPPASVVTAAAKPPLRRRAARTMLSGAALLFAGALVIAVSVPASFFGVAGANAESAPASLVSDAQSVAASGEVDASADTKRSSFAVKSYVQIMAEKYTPTSTQWVPTTGSVRWPFPYAVGISSWFGPRKSTIPGVSSFHKGIDFTPGEGAPTYAIADGVVSMASLSPYGLGNEVIIEHVIDGKHVTSVYGHLEMNSIVVKVGQTVKAGDMVGKTGSTGTVTGANMHLEVHVEGVPVDPYTWLKKNARN